MRAGDNALTLERLAQRLETLERENTELRHKVVTLEGSDTGCDREAASDREHRKGKGPLGGLTDTLSGR
jgi:hypothetical protein